MADFAGRWEYPLSVTETAAASPSEIPLVDPSQALCETPASHPAQGPPDKSVLEPAQFLSGMPMSATSQPLADTPGSHPTQILTGAPVANLPLTHSDTPVPEAAKPAISHLAPADGTTVSMSKTQRDAVSGTSEPGRSATASTQSMHPPTEAVLDPSANPSEDASHEDQAGPATPSAAGETAAASTDQPSSSDQLDAAGSKGDEAHVSAGTGKASMYLCQLRPRVPQASKHVSN